MKIPSYAIGDLMRIARGYDGYACFMPVEKNEKGIHVPIFPEWGLIGIIIKETLDPEELATEEPFEITEWELYDFAVQAVRESMAEAGHTVTSWLCEPGMYPSFWYRDKDANELVWVMVQAFRSHDFDQALPDSLKQMAEAVRKRGFKGFYCAVGLMPTDGKEKLFRGQPADARIGEMQPVDLDEDECREEQEPVRAPKPKLSGWKGGKPPHSLRNDKSRRLFRGRK